jgi:hypothetical protein
MPKSIGIALKKLTTFAGCAIIICRYVPNALWSRWFLVASEAGEPSSNTVSYLRLLNYTSTYYHYSEKKSKTGERERWY